MPPSVLVCLGKPDFHYSVYAGMLSTEPIITLNDESAVDAPDCYRESCEEWHEFLLHYKIHHIRMVSCKVCVIYASVPNYCSMQCMTLCSHVGVCVCVRACVRACMPV